jgi:hypothetical protein
MAAPITVKIKVVDDALLAKAHEYYDDDGEAESHPFEDIIECCEGGQDREFIGDFLENPPSHVIRAKEGGRTVGFAFLSAKGPAVAPFKAYMGTFCGWEEEGKEMIGSKIMKALEKIARDGGYTRLMLDVEDLQYKMGWDEDDREAEEQYLVGFFGTLGYVQSEQHDDGVMVKNLLPPDGEAAPAGPGPAAGPAAAGPAAAGPGPAAAAAAAAAAREARMAEGRRQEAEFDEIEAQAARSVAANTSEAGIGNLPAAAAEPSEEVPEAKEEEEARIGQVPKGGRKTRGKARKTRARKTKKRKTRKTRK